MSNLTVITAPTIEPVTLQEVKQHVNAVEFSDDDSVLNGYIKDGREWAENFIEQKILTQTIERTYDAWPGLTFNLGVWPLQSVDTIAYYDTASPSAEQTLTANVNYYADTTTIGGRIKNIGGWPSVATRLNPIRIRMTAGYATRALVPQAIKTAIIAYIKMMYDNETMDFKTLERILWRQKNWLMGD